MENYIIKMYEQEKNKANRKTTTLRIWVMTLLYVILGWCCNIIITVIARQANLFLICSINIIIMMIAMSIIEYIDERINIAHHKENYEKNVNILHDVIIKVVNNVNKEKIEELINNYQEIIEDKNTKQKSRNKILYAIGTVFGTILSLSFANMDKTGLHFSDWLKVCIIFLFIMMFIMFPIILYNFLDYQKKEYEGIIKDLKNLLLIKY